MRDAVEAVLQWAVADILHLFVTLFLIMWAGVGLHIMTESSPDPTAEARRRAAEQKAHARRQVECRIAEAERLARQRLAESHESAEDVAEAARRFAEMYTDAKKQGRNG